jgi:hypothetical protein
MRKRFCLNGLCAAALLALTGAAAHASFSYSSVPSPGTTPSGGSILTLSPVGSVTELSGSTFVDLADVSLLTTTVPPATDLFSINFSDPISITNMPPPGTAGTGVITLTGTLNFTRSDTGGELSTFTLGSFTPTATIGNTLYTLSNVTYSPPTVDDGPSGNGTISGEITATAVPEPAVASMLVLGMVGTLVRRRNARS